MKSKPIELSSDEQRCIEDFARGETSLRDRASNIFYKYVREWVQGGRQSHHMAFMSEVESPCPDYSLRAHYREMLIMKPLP